MSNDPATELATVRAEMEQLRAMLRRTAEGWTCKAWYADAGGDDEERAVLMRLLDQRGGS